MEDPDPSPASASARHYPRDAVEFGRALSFIDAILGFSITLLITNVQMPAASDWSSVHALLSSPVGDELTGFVISFVVIAGFWRSNHRVIADFDALDTATMSVGIVLAGLVIFIPFTTQGISGGPTAELPLPTALYAVNVTLVVLTTVLLMALGQRRRLCNEPVDRGAVARHLATAAVFLASIPIAYRVGADAAKLSWLSLILVGRVAASIAVSATPRRTRAADRRR